MARTLDELRVQLAKLGPWWLREPEEVMEAVLNALAAVFVRVEIAIDSLHDRTFIDTADGAWLDEHGFERSRPRLVGESDDAYRPRVKAWPDAVTLPVIQEAADAEVDFGEAVIEEWLTDGPFAELDGSGGLSNFASVANLYEDRRGFTIYIDPQVPQSNDTAWAVADGAGSVESFAVLDTGDGVSPADPGSFVDERLQTPSPIYARLYDRIAELKAAGVPFVVVVGGSEVRGIDEEEEE